MTSPAYIYEMPIEVTLEQVAKLIEEEFGDDCHEMIINPKGEDIFFELDGGEKFEVSITKKDKNYNEFTFSGFDEPCCDDPDCLEDCGNEDLYGDTTGHQGNIIREILDKLDIPDSNYWRI